MARAAGVILDCSRFRRAFGGHAADGRVYPNGLADVNHFHAAGGLGYMIGELLDAGLLHPDTQTVAGTGLSHYTKEPKLADGALTWADGAKRR
jgi:phosphogluconate dehydratase